jgi:hypothetical protein
VMLLATEREIRPAKRKRGKFTKKPPNGFGGRAEPRNEVGKVAAKAKAKAKARGRAETVRRSPSTTTGARAMATAGTQQRATSLMMARKEAGRRSGKTTRRHCLQKRSNVRKRKSCQWSLKDWLRKKIRQNQRQDPRRTSSSSFVEERKKKSVGMIGLNLLSPDFVPSLPKPTFKSVLMLPRRGMEARELQPVNRSRARDASEAKAGDVGEETKNGENPISLAHAMSGKVYDEENFKK